MMQTKFEYSDQAFRKLFNRQPGNRLSPDFQEKVMKKILREKTSRQRRNIWCIWGSTSLASLFIISLPIIIFNHFSLDLSRYFHNIFQIPDLRFDNWLPCIFIGASALVLLIIDNCLRKLFLK